MCMVFAESVEISIRHRTHELDISTAIPQRIRTKNLQKLLPTDHAQ